MKPPMLPDYLLTLMRGVLRTFAPSGELSASWACARCGFAMTARAVDGTSLFSYEIAITALPLKPLPCKHVAVVTSTGNVSILCGHGASASTGSVDSGSIDGTSCSPTKPSDAELDALRRAVRPTEDVRYMGNGVYDCRICGHVTSCAHTPPALKPKEPTRD